MRAAPGMFRSWWWTALLLAFPYTSCCAQRPPGSTTSEDLSADLETEDPPISRPMRHTVFVAICVGVVLLMVGVCAYMLFQQEHACRAGTKKKRGNRRERQNDDELRALTQAHDFKSDGNEAASLKLAQRLQEEDDTKAAMMASTRGPYRYPVPEPEPEPEPDSESSLSAYM